MTNVMDTSHNTPPPFLIAAGSLIVERTKEYLPADIQMTMAGRKQHHINADSGMNKIFPGHIKVVDGSGEKLYQKDGAANCTINLQVREQPSGLLIPVKLSASSVVSGKQTFFIETEGSQVLNKASERPSTRRDVRYTLKDGTKTFTLEDIKIFEGTVTTPRYAVNLTTLPAGGDELKIMIWLEQNV